MAIVRRTTTRHSGNTIALVERAIETPGARPDAVAPELLELEPRPFYTAMKRGLDILLSSRRS